MRLSVALSPVKSSFAPLLYSGNIMNGINRAAALGYEGVELNIRDVNQEPLDTIIDCSKRANIEIVALGTGQSYLTDGLSILSPDPQVRDRLVLRLQSHINFAARIGAKLILGGVFGKLVGDDAQREAEKYEALKVVSKLAEYAAGSGVEIVIEPINRYETNFLNTIEQTLAFIAKLGRSGIKVLPDTFHMNIEEASPLTAVTLAAGMIGHVHVADSNRMSPGSGHIDFPSLIRVLKAIKYCGYISGEFLPFPDDETAASSNIRHMRAIITN